MGKSVTINCLGFAPTVDDLGKHSERVFFAMNRREIAQKREVARKDGLKIMYWTAQTGTGRRVLNGKEIEEDQNIEVSNIVQCPVCGGKGYNGKNKHIIKYRCPVCSGSGVTSKGYEKRWTVKQLEGMKRDSAEELRRELCRK